jgi:hypothetical protein
MAIAVILDATDGTLARLARVKEVLPWFDGTLLDEIVDYFNYVIVPCFFLVRANLLPPADALWLAMLPLLASAYGFCQINAKTADNFFLGFPSDQIYLSESQPPIPFPDHFLGIALGCGDYLYCLSLTRAVYETRSDVIAFPGLLYRAVTVA